MITDPLRAKAEAATPGPWKWEPPYEEADYYYLNSAIGTQVHSDGSACGEYGADIDVNGPDGVYIAAANPAVMLSLLDQNASIISALKLAAEALVGAKTEWDKLTRYGSPLAKGGNENFRRVDAALNEIRKIIGE